MGSQRFGIYICIPPQYLIVFRIAVPPSGFSYHDGHLFFLFLVPEGVISPGSRSIYRTPDDIALLFSIFYVVDLVT